MNLRELMMERILFCVTEETLISEFNISTEEIASLSDLDFLELFETICGFEG